MQYMKQQQLLTKSSDENEQMMKNLINERYLNYQALQQKLQMVPEQML